MAACDDGPAGPELATVVGAHPDAAPALDENDRTHADVSTVPPWSVIWAARAFGNAPDPPTGVAQP